MSCDGYCGNCGQPFNYNEQTEEYDYGCDAKCLGFESEGEEEDK